MQIPDWTYQHLQSSGDVEDTLGSSTDNSHRLLTVRTRGLCELAVKRHTVLPNSKRSAEMSKANGNS